jgi:NADH-quinone oxidoreductase subunit J
MELLVFAILALAALAGALGVVFAKNPIHCAICLLVTLTSVAGLFAVLWAEFLAVVQLLVYAGGIMVLFLFVIMLVDLEQRGFDLERGRIGPRVPWVQRMVAGVLAVALAAGFGWLMTPAVTGDPPAAPAVRAALRGAFSADGAVLGNVEWIGQLLYTSYLLPFEVASVTLLVAMIGAVVVARRQA